MLSFVFSCLLSAFSFSLSALCLFPRSRSVTRFFFVSRSRTVTRFFSFLFAFCFPLLAFSQQQYPVKVQATVAFPSAFLSDYSDPSNLSVRVQLQDLARTDYKVLLHVRLQSEKVSFSTRTPIELTLTGGLVYVLSQQELSSLFDPSNLFRTTNTPSPPGTLPEGAYLLSFEAFDERLYVPGSASSVAVSNARTDFASFIVSRHDPALLTLPQNNHGFDLGTSHQVQFSWQMRHVEYSREQRVRYTFRLIKVEPSGRNPYDAMKAAAFPGAYSIVEVDGLQWGQFVLTPEELSLEPGSRYAWQVQGYELSERGEKVTARFKNEGQSEVFTFTVKEHCPSVEKPRAQEMPDMIALSWQGDVLHQSYEVAYRPIGSSVPWTLQQTKDSKLTLTSQQLTPGLQYEYKVTPQCRLQGEARYGGTFTLPLPNCPAPMPVSVAQTEDKTTFSWQPVEGASGYRVSYKSEKQSGSEDGNESEKQSGSEEELKAEGEKQKESEKLKAESEKLKANEGITPAEGAAAIVVELARDVQSLALPKLTSGAYLVRVDAVCGELTGVGKENLVAYNEQGVVGTCPLPTPFQLLATLYKRDTALVSWTSSSASGLPPSTLSPSVAVAPDDEAARSRSVSRSSLYTSYSLSYWPSEASEANKQTLLTPTPHVFAPGVSTGTRYQYRVLFSCGAKYSETPVGIFRLDREDTPPSLDPGTADCFPPASVQAEPISSTSARIEWDKVPGAESYQVLYRKKQVVTARARSNVSPDSPASPAPSVTTGLSLSVAVSPFQVFSTTATSASIKDLEEAPYEYLVKVVCSGKLSLASDTGYVDLSTGRYTGRCDSSSFVLSKQASENEIKLHWQLRPAHTSYVLSYREASQSLKEAYTKSFPDIEKVRKDHVVLPDSVSYVVDGLKSGTAYLFTLQATCGTDNAVRNSSIKANTRGKSPGNSTCSQGKVCDRTGKTPLESLAIGDTIYCADYAIVVREVSPQGTPGRYSGQGLMPVEVAGVEEHVEGVVKFDNVFINARPEACVAEGEIQFTGFTLNALPPELQDQAKKLEEGVTTKLKETQENLDKVDEKLDKSQDVVQEGTDYFQGGDKVGQVKSGEVNTKKVEATIPVTTQFAEVIANTVSIGGKKVQVESLPALVEDNEGKVFQVGALGEVVFIGNRDASLASKNIKVDVSKGRVDFSGNPSAKYDFDAWFNIYKDRLQIEREYELILPDYHVPSKLMLPGEIDKVNAQLLPQTGSSYNPANILFASSTGLIYRHIQQGNLFTITLAGGKPGDAQEVYAWHVSGSEKVAIGKLLLPCYQPQQKTIVIVPVGEAQVDARAIQDTLNKAYSPLGITYTVKVDEGFRTNTVWDVNNDNRVQSSTSKTLSNDYQGEEAALIDAYVKARGAAKIDPAAGYFFAMNEPSTIEDALLGKMPMGSQFGFLYVGAVSRQGVGRTVAHEVGHGAYHLEHIFQDVYLGSTWRSKTKNLMDYQQGLQLWKYQWDVIHDPGHVWSVLKKDRDEQLVADNIAKCLFAAGLDFAFYYGITWISACLDDETFKEDRKPWITDFTTVTSYKEWNWSEALVSAGVSCAAANLPAILSPQTTKKVEIGLAALAGAAEGFAVETAKQYELAYKRLVDGKSLQVPKVKATSSPGMVEVMHELQWQPIIFNSLTSGLITGTVSYLASSAKFTAVVNKVKQKLKLVDFAKQQKEVVDWLAKFVSKGSKKFIAKSGKELQQYLEAVSKIPTKEIYEGSIYKSISKDAEKNHGARPDIISKYSIDESWGRYDKPGESAMYYSKTFIGNKNEMSHYGDWDSFSTYEFKDVQIDNLLDLSNIEVQNQLGVSFEQLVSGISDKVQAYEYTNVLGTWARKNGYKGLMVPGARGTRDYINIIIFDQIYLNNIINNVTPTPLK